MLAFHRYDFRWLSFVQKHFAHSNCAPDSNVYHVHWSSSLRPTTLLSTKSPRQIVILRSDHSAPTNQSSSSAQGFGFTLRHFIVYPPEVSVRPKIEPNWTKLYRNHDSKNFAKGKFGKVIEHATHATYIILQTIIRGQDRVFDLAFSKKFATFCIWNALKKKNKMTFLVGCFTWTQRGTLNKISVCHRAYMWQSVGLFSLLSWLKYCSKLPVGRLSSFWSCTSLKQTIKCLKISVSF